MSRIKLSHRILSLAAGSGIAIASTLVLGGGPAAASVPHAHPMSTVTVSGDVVCEDGSAVEGVWIQAAGGSGWASGTSVFNKSGVTVPWTVHVGCGGSPSNWATSVYGEKSITSSFANWGCWPHDTYFDAAGCWTPAN